MHPPPEVLNTTRSAPGEPSSNQHAIPHIDKHHRLTTGVDATRQNGELLVRPRSLERKALAVVEGVGVVVVADGLTGLVQIAALVHGAPELRRRVCVAAAGGGARLALVDGDGVGGREGGERGGEEEVEADHCDD